MYIWPNTFIASLGIAAVDFEKAFDSVSHESIWEALQSQNVPTEYIEVLQRLFSGQTGQIVADKTSRSFELGKGGQSMVTLLVLPYSMQSSSNS